MGGVRGNVSAQNGQWVPLVDSGSGSFTSNRPSRKKCGDTDPEATPAPPASRTNVRDRCTMPLMSTISLETGVENWQGIVAELGLSDVTASYDPYPPMVLTVDVPPWAHDLALNAAHIGTSGVYVFS